MGQGARHPTWAKLKRKKNWNKIQKIILKITPTSASAHILLTALGVHCLGLGLYLSVQVLPIEPRWLNSLVSGIYSVGFEKGGRTFRSPSSFNVRSYFVRLTKLDWTLAYMEFCAIFGSPRVPRLLNSFTNYWNWAKTPWKREAENHNILRTLPDSRIIHSNWINW